MFQERQRQLHAARRAVRTAQHAPQLVPNTPCASVHAAIAANTARTGYQPVDSSATGLHTSLRCTSPWTASKEASRRGFVLGDHARSMDTQSVRTDFPGHPGQASHFVGQSSPKLSALGTELNETPIIQNTRDRMITLKAMMSRRTHIKASSTG